MDPAVLIDTRLQALLGLATGARSREEFRTEALRWLDRYVGFDTALLGRAEVLGPGGPLIQGFDQAFLDQFVQGAPRYAPAVMRLIATSAQTGRPLRDVDLFSRRERAREPFYTELIGPKGSRVMLISALQAGAGPLGSLQISRNGAGATFSDNELALVQAASAILALGDGLHPSAGEQAPLPPLASEAPPAEVPSLTPRELDVLEYLSLGFTNSEIALALGNAKNTVRNQVASLLRKLEASTRTEAVSIALSAGLVTPRPV